MPQPTFKFSEGSSHPRALIRVGTSWQARLPPCNPCVRPRDMPEVCANHEALEWLPTKISDSSLIMYLRAARSMAAFASMCDGGSTQDGCLAASRDHTTMNALQKLHEHKYDTTKALQSLARSPPLRGIEHKWNEEDTKLFVKGLRQFGKNFFKIRKEYLPHKETGELVDFYYIWKKTPAAKGNNPNGRRPRKPAGRKNKGRRSSAEKENKDTKEKQTSSPTKSGESGSSFSEDENENESDDDSPPPPELSTCGHCLATISKGWQKFGPGGSSLCSTCHLHVKIRGDLPDPSQADRDILFKPVCAVNTAASPEKTVKTPPATEKAATSTLPNSPQKRNWEDSITTTEAISQSNSPMRKRPKAQQGSNSTSSEDSSSASVSNGENGNEGDNEQESTPSSEEKTSPSPPKIELREVLPPGSKTPPPASPHSASMSTFPLPTVQKTAPVAPSPSHIVSRPPPPPLVPITSVRPKQEVPVAPSFGFGIEQLAGITPQTKTNSVENLLPPPPPQVESIDLSTHPVKIKKEVEEVSQKPPADALSRPQDSSKPKSMEPPPPASAHAAPPAQPLSYPYFMPHPGLPLNVPHLSRSHGHVPKSVPGGQGTPDAVKKEEVTVKKEVAEVSADRQDEEDKRTPHTLQRTPSPEATSDCTELFRTKSAVFIRAIFRGSHSSCSRTDYHFKPVPESALAKKREEKAKKQMEQKEEKPKISAMSADKKPPHHHHQSETRIPNVLRQMDLPIISRASPRPFPSYDTPALRALSQYASPHLGYHHPGIPFQGPPGFAGPGGGISPYAVDPLHYYMSMLHLYPPGSRERLEIEAKIEQERREREFRELEFREKLKLGPDGKPLPEHLLGGPHHLDPRWLELQRHHAVSSLLMSPNANAAAVAAAAASSQERERLERERFEQLGIPVSVAGAHPGLGPQPVPPTSAAAYERLGIPVPANASVNPGNVPVTTAAPHERSSQPAHSQSSSSEQSLREGNVSAERLHIERMMAADPMARFGILPPGMPLYAAHMHAHAHTHLHLHEPHLQGSGAYPLNPYAPGAPPDPYALAVAGGPFLPGMVPRPPIPGGTPPHQERNLDPLSALTPHDPVQRQLQMEREQQLVYRNQILAHEEYLRKMNALPK